MIKERIINFINKYFAVLVGIILGFICFVLVYGTNTLNVQYDSWIMKGYMDNDIQQHYAGWVNFRNSDWSFPLAKADNLNEPNGTVISYTDSIPLFAIIFKLLRGFLPATFQFFGIYILLCFILQGISAGKLIGIFTNKKLHITIGMLLFILSPVMIERAFRHTALASHWLILFSLYLYFKARKEQFAKIKWQFIVLNALAITIHPYFLPMIMGIAFATSLEAAIKKKEYLKNTIFIIANLFIVVLIGILIGVIGFETSLGSTGFGYYSMNLNAIINPTSYGVKSWSTFLKARPMILGNYDGFNYLGLGVIMIGAFCLIYSILQNNYKTFFKKIIFYLKSHSGLIIVLVAFYIFAISNVITLDGKEILKYPLPEFILNFCGIFRASSRIFYPIFYMIFLTEIVFILKNFKTRNITILLVILIIIQMIDIGPTLYQKNKYFKNEIKSEEFSDNTWQKIEKNVSKIYTLECDIVDNKKLAIFCGKNNIRSNINITNREIKYETNTEEETLKQDLIDGKNPLGESMILITTNEMLFRNLTIKLNEQIVQCKLDKYMILVPKKIIEGK